MPPNWVLDKRFVFPLLRGHVQYEELVAVQIIRMDQLIRIMRIGRVDVVVKRRGMGGRP